MGYETGTAFHISLVSVLQRHWELTMNSCFVTNTQTLPYQAKYMLLMPLSLYFRSGIPKDCLGWNLGSTLYSLCGPARYVISVS